ncbi:MAG: helix-turn-helix domain-containing protein [Candidatus Aenigmarchaeota archaeon]|nr:helix-turn-helix domain-containing protein [Candidatus Aenigmarchaeota archaeon]
MVATQKVFDALKQIGLNLYERKLWVALLSRGTSSAGELSSLAKVPHSRTYDVLESLAEKGFVIVQNTKPLKYVAIAPSEALERAKKKIHTDADEMVGRITEFQDSPLTKELTKIFKDGMDLVEPGEMLGSLKGRHSMHTQLETLFKGAKSDISILTTADGMKELHSNHADLLKKASSKGVKVRIIAPSSKEVSEQVAHFKGFATVKQSDKTGTMGRFAIVDGNHVVFALTDDKKVHPTQDLSFWSQSTHVAKEVLGPMFDAYWNTL